MNYEESMQSHVRDRRISDWFWVNKEIVDDYGARIGPNGIALYAYLARCAGDKGVAFPSIRGMSKKLGMSTTTVQKYIEVLVSESLISRVLRHSSSGDLTSTEYTLLSPCGGVSRADTPVCHELTHRVSRSDTELDLLKENNVKENYPPIVPQGYGGTDMVAEGESLPQEVARGGKERLDAASRPGHNMVTRGDALLGEAEGEYHPHPRDNSEHPQSTQEPQNKAPELDSSDRGKTRKTRHIEDEAQEVLAHLNRITGKRLTSTGLIPARLKEGRTVAECTLVLEWMLATWSKDYADRSVNYETPFRARKFELYLDSAQRWGWTQQPKTLFPTPSPAAPGNATTVVPDDLMAMINTTIPERSPHAAR